MAINNYEKLNKPMLKIAILGLGEGRSTMSAALKSAKLELVKVCDLNE